MLLIHYELIHYYGLWIMVDKLMVDFWITV